MPRRGENIYKRKDGRWEGRYIKDHVDGKAKYGSLYGKSYSEVKNKLCAIKSKENCKDHVENSITGNHSNFTFDMISMEWLNSLKPQIKRSSFVKYSNTITSYLSPSLSSRKMVDITRNDISMLCSELSETGGSKCCGLSSKTIADTLSILRSIFEYASNERELSVADVSGISVKLAHNNMRILSLSEQRQLEVYLRSEHDPCSIGILLCLYTGLRIGELCALTWNDISEKERTVHVTRTMQRLQILDAKEDKNKTEIIISSPKSNCSIREIPIPDDIFHLMQEYRKEGSAYILTGKKDRYMEPRTLENRFKRVLVKNEIENANFHALRHTFATRCIELGFDIKSLSEILGHASVNITLNRYVHPSMALKQKNMNMLSSLFTV